MASASSSTVMASPAATATLYDVFLSFRGKDTRQAFADHLYAALVRAGIHPFRDTDEIDRGEGLKPEIEKAIKESRASIVVLSENYATSTWCLDELCLILEQRRDYNHFVLPVFYRVDPSDVRKHNKTFMIKAKTSSSWIRKPIKTLRKEVKPSSSRWTYDNVNRWKTALSEVADLTGVVVSLSGSETIFLKEIVDTIYNKLDCKQVHLPPNLTGMDTRYEDINSWLTQSNLQFLAICGMGGSGKTTMAKYIYNSNCKRFENKSFVEDIGSRCKGHKGLLELQEQLLKDILGGREQKLLSVSVGTSKIAEALKKRRTLIVLDDVAEHNRLVDLLDTGKINAHSKIIITTRENTESLFKFNNWRFQEYKMKLLNVDESLELLSLQAFGSKIPIEGFMQLAREAVQYCEGNPLALEVLASSLSNCHTIPYWKSHLNLLEKDFDSRIESVLITSYMSLPHESEKALFLHIACFFIGKDVDYVEKILEPDYFAVSGIKTLTNRCLVYVSPNKKLMMHRLLQEMGKNIVRQESLQNPSKRSRVWCNTDSERILRKGMSSRTILGLSLVMERPERDKFAFEPPCLKTDALRNMDKLKLLQLKFVPLIGSYENFSEDLRWLCWFGFNLPTIPCGFFMGNLVAIDMSYSNLEVFEPPMVLNSLKILNLKDSDNLLEIRNISRIPHLETLILWNCQSLGHVCETIGDLTSLALLNMTGCENLFKREIPYTFSFPHSLHQLFLNDCNLECSDFFPLSFSVQPFLQYLNLSNGLFEFLPGYHHLKNLRVLDLTCCQRLKWLLCLPSTLAELYIYYCVSLEEITFQSHRYTLQKFGYEGCFRLSEIEGFIKLVPLSKLDETDLGHMKWLKEYQYHEVCLVGDDELTTGRIWLLQMLYEFNIMSTSLPDIEDPKLTPEYLSKSPSLSFKVPSCPKNRRLKGLNVTFKYTKSGEDWAWFAKINTTNGVDLIYNPKVFGRPLSHKVATWLSYWPIGNTLDIGDKVNVSIVVMSGLEVCECGASLVYIDDEVVDEAFENNTGWVETLGGDLSGFQLSTGAYYLCRRDFYELMQVGRLTPGWFRILVGDTVDVTEVRGWRKTGRPKHSNPSFTELETIGCILDGHELEEIDDIANESESDSEDSMSDELKEKKESATKKS